MKHQSNAGVPCAECGQLMFTKRSHVVGVCLNCLSAHVPTNKLAMPIPCMSQMSDRLQTLLSKYKPFEGESLRDYYARLNLVDSYIILDRKSVV